MKLLLSATLFAVALALPTAASAGLASITFRDVPVHGERTLAASPGRFDLVGLRWRGTGSVRFSVHSTAGGFGPWLDATVEEDDQPDMRSRESVATRGFRVGNPTWVGPSDGIRYRITGHVEQLTAAFVRSPEVKIPLRAIAAAGSPPIVPRAAWGADESIRRNEPEYAPSVHLAIVHHTAGPNNYSPSEAAAIMRGIEIYHVKSNGWNDIGYNFLVDRYGTVYEGRYGGIDQNVIGAHARGFNTGSVGVAVIGTFSGENIPAAAEASLSKLLAWRLDLAHVDPLSTFTAISGGSEKYAAGKSVTLRAISGHRDTGSTACPGDRLYARLAAIAAKTQAIGLPKLYEPLVTGTVGGPVRFRARVSAPLAWKVTVTDALGQELASGSGLGPTVDWTWDASLVVEGVHWQIDVASATSAAGTLGKQPAAVPLAISGAPPNPDTISPNGDGVADTSTISYTTTAASTVIATLLDVNGGELAEIQPASLQPAGQHTFVFDGLGQPDGSYTILITAVDPSGAAVSFQTSMSITRTLGSVALTPALFTPNGDGKGDELHVAFQLAVPATVRLRVLRNGVWVATPFSGPLDAGPQTIAWDGSKRVGVAPDGAYSAVVEATDAIGTSTVSLAFAKDTHPPTIKLFARSPRLWISEAATLTVRVNGKHMRVEVPAPGYLTLSGIKRIRSIVVVARDAAGNRAVLTRSPM